MLDDINFYYSGKRFVSDRVKSKEIKTEKSLKFTTGNNKDCEMIISIFQVSSEGTNEQFLSIRLNSVLYEEEIWEANHNAVSLQGSHPRLKSIFGTLMEVFDIYLESKYDAISTNVRKEIEYIIESSIDYYFYF